jgi:hypothetical protein
MLFNNLLVLLHPLMLYVLMCAILVGFSLAILILVRWSVHRHLQGKHNELAGYLFNAVGVIYGVLLALVAIMVWEQYNNAINNSVVEAGDALTLYRDLDLYPDQNQANQAKQALIAYIHSVIHEEYPAMAQGKKSPSTHRAIDNLWKTAKNFKPRDSFQQTIFQNILDDFDNLVRMRTLRLSAAETSLPNIVWAVLIIGAGVTMIFAALFGAERFWPHMVLVILLAILMATTMFLILEMDNPFLGGLSPQPKAHLEVLKMIRSE